MADLSEYKVTLRCDPYFGLWSFAVKTPDGRKLNDLGSSVSKTAVESRALRRIEIDRSTETLTGVELAARVATRQTA